MYLFYKIKIKYIRKECEKPDCRECAFLLYKGKKTVDFHAICFLKHGWNHEIIAAV